MSCGYAGCEYPDADRHIHTETGPVGKSVILTSAQLDAFYDFCDSWNRTVPEASVRSDDDSDYDCGCHDPDTESSCD